MNDIVPEARAECEGALEEKLDVISFSNAAAALLVIMDILIACGLETFEAGMRALLE